MAERTTRKSKGLLYELKFLSRRMQLYALKYDWCLQGGRKVDAERLLKKSARYDKRIKQIKEILFGEEDKPDPKKENTDVANNRISGGSIGQDSRKLAGDSEGKSRGEDSDRPSESLSKS